MDCYDNIDGFLFCVHRKQAKVCNVVTVTTHSRHGGGGVAEGWCIGGIVNGEGLIKDFLKHPIQSHRKEGRRTKRTTFARS